MTDANGGLEQGTQGTLLDYRRKMTFTAVREGELALSAIFTDWALHCNRIASPSSGYVYVFQSLDGSGLSKIGVSDNIHSRFRRIRQECGGAAQIIIVIRTDDRWGMENWLSHHFASKRKHGEWYALDEQDLSWLRERHKPFCAFAGGL